MSLRDFLRDALYALTVHNLALSIDCGLIISSYDEWPFSRTVCYVLTVLFGLDWQNSLFFCFFCFQFSHFLNKTSVSGGKFVFSEFNFPDNEAFAQDFQPTIQSDLVYPATLPENFLLVIPGTNGVDCMPTISVIHCVTHQ